LQIGDAWKQSALQQAANKGSLQTPKYFLNDLNLNKQAATLLASQKTEDGETLFHRAIDHPEIIEWLVNGEL